MAGNDEDEDSDENDDDEDPEEETDENKVNQWEQVYVPPSVKEAEAREAELTDTPLFAMVKESIATLESATVDTIAPGNGGNPANVKRVESIMTEEQWDYLFAVRDPDYTYRRYKISSLNCSLKSPFRFLQAIGKFPSVCADYSDGRDADAICRKTLATMFAHFTQETGGHNPNGEVEEWRQVRTNNFA